jgi:drug/metabolite transporter (DMT)-like permease
MSEKPKGLFFMMLSVVAMANVYIFSNVALRELDLMVFGFFWYGFALMYNVIYMFCKYRRTAYKLPNWRDFRLLYLIGLLDVVATICFFSAIKMISSPTVVAFFTNLIPLFVCVLGIPLLGERFTTWEVIGSILVICGALTIAFNPDPYSTSGFINGILLTMAYNIFTAITVIISKKHIRQLNPLSLTLNRSILLFIVAAAALLITGQSPTVGLTTIGNLALGALLGPFTASIAAYTALKYMDASKASVIGNLKGLFVLATGYAYFGNLPLSHQLIGGLITVVGVTLISSKSAFDKLNILLPSPALRILK